LQYDIPSCCPCACNSSSSLRKCCWTSTSSRRKPLWALSSSARSSCSGVREVVPIRMSTKDIRGMLTGPSPSGSHALSGHSEVGKKAFSILPCPSLCCYCSRSPAWAHLSYGSNSPSYVALTEPKVSSRLARIGQLFFQERGGYG